MIQIVQVLVEAGGMNTAFEFVALDPVHANLVEVTLSRSSSSPGAMRDTLLRLRRLEGR